jgi:hypothetical protein
MMAASKGVCRVAAAVALVPWTVSHAVPSTSDDRIALSGNGTTETNTGGGGGGSAGWLHNFDADTLFGLAAEHEKLDVSHWNFGTLSGAATRGAGDARYTLYGDARAGSGRDGGKYFKYLLGTLGVTGTYFHRLSVTLEDKQFDIETTHGNLPKLQAAYLWNPHLQTTLSYAYSFGGNLGTRLTTARVDGYFKPLPQWRSDLTLIVDYQHLSGGTGTTTIVDPFTGLPVTTTFLIRSSQRWTGTLNYIFHIGHHGT